MVAMTAPFRSHRLVGYDRFTGRVVDEYALPEERLPEAKRLAHVPEDDPEATLCYSLGSAARELAGFIGARIRPDCDYFLEGFAA